MVSCPREKRPTAAEARTAVFPEVGPEAVLSPGTDQAFSAGFRPSGKALVVENGETALNQSPLHESGQPTNGIVQVEPRDHQSWWCV